MFQCLNIYKKNELESRIINMHLSRGLTDFNRIYLNKLLENISKGQNFIFLLIYTFYFTANQNN